MDNGREQEILFAKTLELVRQQAKEQGGMIEEADVKKAFAALELTQAQLEMVFDYLQKHKIGIGEPVNYEEYLTDEDTDYLTVYLEELKEIPPYSEGEKEAAAISAMAGEAAAKTRMIEICLPQVVEIAKLYAGQGVFVEDLIGEGNVALAAGVEMLGCLEHHSEAQGMLAKMMMDAMEDYIGENMQSGETDKSVLEKVNKVYQKSKEMAESLLRKVSREELSEETGLSVEEIEEAVRISGYKMDYIEEKKNEEN